MNDKNQLQNFKSVERITNKIYLIRDQRVLLDQDLAILYGVETKQLGQAVKRNKERFPDDFMFQLSNTEFENLRSQIVTSKRGGRRYRPFAFTEQCVAMLSSQAQKRIWISKKVITASLLAYRYFGKFEFVTHHDRFFYV